MRRFGQARLEQRLKRTITFDLIVGIATLTVKYLDFQNLILGPWF
jgi:hypothetical protein